MSDEKPHSHNSQSRHPAWWSADNSSFFPTVNILTEERSEPAKEIIKKWKNNIMHLCFLAYCINLSFGTEIAGEIKPQPC